MSDNIALNELFSEDELNTILDKGISLGIERAKDENINFEINYDLRNGNGQTVDEYTKRLNNKTLNDREQSIINKYEKM